VVLPENELQFTGERLIPGVKTLHPMFVENLARFDFFRKHAQGSFILDLGCGVGDGTAFLSQQHGWHAVGVDIAPDAVYFARHQHGTSGVSFAQMDVQRLGFANGCFDSIVSVEVIEHIPNPDGYLAEAARVLRKGGLFMLTTPNRLRSSPTPNSLWPEHLREFNPHELTELLSTTFPQVELWGECIPLYEAHPLRKLVRKLAPFIKPLLPHWLRVRALPTLQTAIKADLSLQDVHFSQFNLKDLPTLVALCRK